MMRRSVALRWPVVIRRSAASPTPLPVPRSGDRRGAQHAQRSIRYSQDSTRRLAPGDTFAGHRIESLAGRGAMGLVYRARQLRPDRPVAVKVIMPELARHPDFRARFEREATLAAQVEHPNVIPVYGIGEQDGLLFIAMRFAENRDVGVELRASAPLALPRAARIIAQAAAALDAAHACGVVHRDVKPANLLRGAGDHVYLADFGLTKSASDTFARGITAPGGVVGTLDYIAPEQATGASVDSRSDIYALGCVLYHLLTGTVPFPRDRDVAKIFAHVSLRPPRPSAAARSIPVALDTVVARAMAKDPAARYQSAGDLAMAAVAAAEGPPGDRPAVVPGRNAATSATAPSPASTRTGPRNSARIAARERQSGR